ncbi:MAG TPA: alpha/beta fold hydrolase [Pyrinomonadaceae bacterium]|nr:alpha/beta fold hydrolase [Pyrinomonadaceae bacterium]
MVVFTRERLIGIIIAVILGGVAFVFGLRWLEFLITFHPDRIPANHALAVPAGAEEVWFAAADGTRLHGWFFRSESAPGTATVIYFHGNGGNITNIDWVGQRLARRGFDVLLFDYRGYGKSEGEVGAESGLYADGDAALAFVISQKGARAERVILYGQSLGTTVAADIASRQNVGAVILESGLSSASSVARTALPWLPEWLHFLGTNRFDSARKLAHVKAPVLILTASRIQSCRQKRHTCFLRVQTSRSIY